MLPEFAENNLAAIGMNRAREVWGEVKLISKYKDGRHGPDWQSYSVAEQVGIQLRLAIAWKRLGLEPQDRVAIMAPNRPRWVFTLNSLLMDGLVAVPIYPTILPENDTTTSSLYRLASFTGSNKSRPVGGFGLRFFGAVRRFSGSATLASRLPGRPAPLLLRRHHHSRAAFQRAAEGLRARREAAPCPTLPGRAPRCHLSPRSRPPCDDAPHSRCCAGSSPARPAQTRAPSASGARHCSPAPAHRPQSGENAHAAHDSRSLALPFGSPPSVVTPHQPCTASLIRFCSTTFATAWIDPSG